MVSNCEMNNLDLCFSCERNNDLGECMILHFRKMLEGKSSRNEMKEYIMEVMRNKFGMLIYGRDSLKYLRKAIDLYYPEHIGTYDKISILF